MTPTGRALAHLRRRGYLAAVVECWVPHTRIRRDPFGVADVPAAHPRGRPFPLVPGTAASHPTRRRGYN